MSTFLFWFGGRVGVVLPTKYSLYLLVRGGARLKAFVNCLQFVASCCSLLCLHGGELFVGVA